MLPASSRTARLNGPWLAFLASVAALFALIALLVFDVSAWFQPRPAARPLLVFCAAGLKAPVEATAREYEVRYGVPVQLQYGGSNSLLAQLTVADKGDLYIPADDSYVRTARDKGLVAEVLPLAAMRPVLVVAAGNPQGFRSLDDVLARKARLAQANPEAAAIGKVTRDLLETTGQWQEVAAHTVVYKPTVNDVAVDVRLKTVEAGFVWDATVKQIPGLEVVPEPALARTQASLSACVLRHSKQPTATLRFARYLSARNSGLANFAQAGYQPAEGDDWEEEPDLKLLVGAMLRPAVEQTITAFEEREGVQVTRVYNGCGILVAQMRAGQHPDAYFACDQQFMDQVADLFTASQPVSTNELVILVQKGNPHGITGLKDLGKKGLKVGVGHEKQCAMGAITQETLRQDRSTTPVMRNVVVQSPTGDLLVNQMRTGSLDACIAYLSNAAGASDILEAIRIDIPCAVATQPIAVGKNSPHKQLAGRLIHAIRTAESRERFEAFGFKWVGAGAAPTGKVGVR